MNSSNRPIRVAALYHFCRFETAEAVAHDLRGICAREGIKGTLILAPEGINGTIAGESEAVQKLVGFLQSLTPLAGIEVKYSSAQSMPFHRMKVRLKQEIVTMGVGGIDPETNAGAYVAARDWNELVSDPQTLVIDTRNSYETAIGSFEGAIDPGTDSFREFPAWVDDNRQMLEGHRIAMFCTGGIRCEKATAYLKSVGFEDVHHLKGGILKYLEEVPAEQSRWRGECFVFDERVSVGPGLVPGDATLCRACRHPLTGRDRQSPHFSEGISCPHCHDRRTEQDRRRYAERQRQVELATERGDGPHIGR